MILRRNRRILFELNRSGKTKIHKNNLINRGFNFNYMTHYLQSEKGWFCYYCYEQGFINNGNDYLTLISSEEDI